MSQKMSAISRINRKIAEGITRGVSTMWCAYIFAAIALISLPNAIRSHDTIIIVSWVAQTFLQLVLLSIIMVGQSVQSESVSQQIAETHTAAIGEFELAKEARADSALEISELKEISREMKQLITEVEKKLHN
jgi:hypothetical protein